MASLLPRILKPLTIISPHLVHTAFPLSVFFFLLGRFVVCTCIGGFSHLYSLTVPAHTRLSTLGLNVLSSDDGHDASQRWCQRVG